MLFNNLTQFIVLALVFIMGFVFGLASHNGGKKWRGRYDKEVETGAQRRAELDGQMRECESRAVLLERDNTDLENRLAVAEARSSDLEAKRAELERRLAAPAAVAAIPVAPPDPVVEAGPAPVVVEAETEAEAARKSWFGWIGGNNGDQAATAAPAPIEPEKPTAKGWFGMGRADGGDDLSRLSGIDDGLKAKLADLDVTRYSDITSLSAEDEIALEQRLGIPAGYITREQWREQAALLARAN